MTQTIEGGRLYKYYKYEINDLVYVRINDLLVSGFVVGYEEGDYVVRIEYVIDGKVHFIFAEDELI